MDETIMKITGDVDLSQISQEDFKDDVDVRVAVVRDGNILGSSILKVSDSKDRRLHFGVEFPASILPFGRYPCPVTLVIGPAVSDRELFQLQTTSMIVDLAPPKRETTNVAEAAVAFPLEKQVGSILVEPAIYLCWIFCCRTYTITGRVVCRNWHYNPILQRYILCDDPVPGAKVEAYDVDRFLWWYWRDIISSAVTDINGNFAIKFTWCCLRWYPWFQPNLTIDPDIFSRVQKLFFDAQLPFPPHPGPDPTPALFQQLIGSADSLPGSLLRSATQGDATLPVSNSNDSLSREDLLSLLPPSPELEALHVWPWWNWSDCAPDVVFRVTQRCEGKTHVIYNETNAQTRWNISNPLQVTLIANKLACCIPICRDPECPECLKLTVIGCTQVDQIGNTIGPPDLRGYARVGISATDPYKDNPFYGSLQMRGAVGWDVDYFKVQYSKDGGAWTDLPTPAFSGLGRSYWDGSDFIPVADFSPAPKNGQTVIITRRHYEDLNPAIPRFGGSVIWNDYDTLFYFDTLANTALTPDALYELRFVAYAADGADNLIPASERILPTCGKNTAESVYLRIDNQGSMHPVPTLLHPCTIIHKCTNEPDCYIRKICKNEGQPDEICISACDILSLNPNDTLTIHFSVTCPPTVQDGHLGGYWLRAEYGVSQAFYIGTGTGTFQADPTIEVGPNYSDALSQGAPRPHWYGGDYKVTLLGSDFPVCCAYLLRLWAWKRTTNGCSNPTVTHWNQFEFSFTVLRPELCPGICSERE